MLSQQNDIIILQQSLTVLIISISFLEPHKNFKTCAPSHRSILWNVLDTNISVLWTFLDNSQVKYLECLMNEPISGEAMALNFIQKINKKLKFLYCKNDFLTPALRRLVCNSLRQAHFDYACSSRYSNLTKDIKTQNSNHSKQMHALLLAIRKIKTYIS